MGTDRTTFTGTQTTPFPVSWTQTDREPSGSDWDPFRPEDGDPLGGLTAGDGMRIRNELLAQVAGLAAGGCLAENPRGPFGQTQPGRADRLVTGRGRQQFHQSRKRGPQTGPNPTDRRKYGSKHHVITDANGIPLATCLTGANRHDITQLIPLVDGLPHVRGKRGRPRHYPDVVQADRGYDSEPHRNLLIARGIKPSLAKRRTPHGSGLGTTRWVVERTIAWLHQFRRLRIRFERRDDIHAALLSIGCSIICSRFLLAL